jgi:hypothetical protein
VCGNAGVFTNVTHWPELKTSQHINALGLNVVNLRVTGSPLR